MKDKREAIALIYHTNPMTPEVLKKAEELGMIPKRDLKPWAYYSGSCRNARIAMWDSNRQLFIHLRTKFRDTFAETIPHPEDDEGWDVFIPVEEIKLGDNW